MTTPLADGIHVIGKRDCPTCTMIEPVLTQVAESGMPLTVYSQDDPIFPESISGVVDDTSLEQSYRLGIETVPTLIRIDNGKAKFTDREVRLETRRLDKGTHWPI